MLHCYVKLDRWNNSDLPSEVVPDRVSRFDFNVVGCQALAIRRYPTRC